MLRQTSTSVLACCLVAAVGCRTAGSREIAFDLSASFDDSSEDGTEESEPFDLTEFALIASGYESELDRARARAHFETLLEPVLVSVRGQPRAEWPSALLKALHGPLLDRYDVRATTLRDILEGRRFNCLSASVVYNLAAERLGLSTFAELLPTHARSVVEATPGKWTVVETTSPAGHAPTEGAQALITAQVRDARPLVPVQGVRVTTLVLVGSIYVNRASLAQTEGDLKLAEQLFSRGESVAPSDAVRSVLRDQRAALLSQIAAEDMASTEPRRLERAYATAKAAASLKPWDDTIARAVRKNLRAAAERLIALLIDRGDEQAAMKLAGEASTLGLLEPDRAGLRAFARSELGRLRVKQGDLQGALEVVEQAMLEPLAAAEGTLRQTLFENRLGLLRALALNSARDGNLDTSLAFLRRLDAAQTEDDRRGFREDQRKVFQLIGQRKLEEHHYADAVDVYREGFKRFPDDRTLRHNLKVALEHMVVPLVVSGACAEASGLLDEIEAIEGNADFAARGRAQCWVVEAKQLLGEGRIEPALERLRAAERAQPNDSLVRRNLAVGLLHQARVDVAEGRCAQARRLLDEVTRLGAAALSVRERLDAALVPCGAGG